MDNQKQPNSTSHSAMHQQVIEHLRREIHDLRIELDGERTRQKNGTLQGERELKTAQRQIETLSRTQAHLEVRIEVSEGETREALAALQEARNVAKKAEAEAAKITQHASWQCSQSEERINRLEVENQLAKEEISQLKSQIEKERFAAATLVREHSAEVKSLRGELKTKLIEANKELQDRSMRDYEECRTIRSEAEKVQKLIEHDFRSLLTEKEEELRRARADAFATQKTLEEQIRDSMKTAMSRSLAQMNSGDDLVQSLQHEIHVLKLRNRKLEKKILACEDATVEATRREEGRSKDALAGMEKKIRSEIHTLLQSLKLKDHVILKQTKQMDKTSQLLEKLRNRCAQLTDRVQYLNDDAKKKTKPQLPLKSAKVLETKTNALNRDNHSHVKDIVRQLQEKECEGKDKKRVPLQIRIPNHQTLDNVRSTNRTIEDLKAIDADIEKLRRQIEDRDRVINRLRDETRTKDQQLQMMIINRKQGIDENSAVGINMCTSPDASSVSSGSDGTSPIPSDTISYLDFLNQPKKTFAKNDNDLDENRNESCTCQTLQRQVKDLKERETRLLAETALLREQNDLMEFRILELEECRSGDPVHSLWQSRDNEDVSDSGVMSLPTSEDLTSDSDSQSASGRAPAVEIKLTGVATVFPSVQKKSVESLQESGIFEDGDISQSASTHSECTALFKSTDHKASQTDVVSSKTPELTAELWKLSEIQKRIQSETKTPYAFCLADYITFYEERLMQFQEKLSIYESKGDNRDRLLSKRLEKEVSLAYEMRGLKATIAKLQERNSTLEEDRCEFEEAENDARLQCQSLEFQMQELTETKVQLEIEIDKLQKHAQEKRLRGGRGDLSDKIFRLETEIKELKNKASRDEEALKDMEAQLDEKEEKMEALLQLKLDVTAADAQIMSKQLGYNLNEEGDGGHVENELRERIDTLEKTNQAFIQALSNSDQIWATQEEEYRERISNLEKSYQLQLKNIRQDMSQLQSKSEHATAKLEIAECWLQKMEDLQACNDALKSQLQLLSGDILSRNQKIKDLESDRAALLEKLEIICKDLEKEMKKKELLNQRELELQLKISQLMNELEVKNKEISDLEVTTSELKEEVETLEALKPTTPSKTNLSPVVEPKKSNVSVNCQKPLLKPPHETLKCGPEGTEFLINGLWNLVNATRKPEKSSMLENYVNELNLKNSDLLAVLRSTQEENKRKETEIKRLENQLKQSLPSEKACEEHDVTKYFREIDLNPIQLNRKTSTLQLDLDNLQTKCRQKTQHINKFLDLNDKKQNRGDFSAAHFAIVKINQINANSLFVAWDTEAVPQGAHGYSISVNGRRCVVISGRHRNLAILNNLNLSERCLIEVSPISSIQRFGVTATAHFPPLLND